MSRNPLLKDLQQAPGIGPNLAQDLLDLGVRTIDELARREPQGLYEELCALRGERIDRCVLYAFRCAVYWAGAEQPEAELCKWWSWKDGGPAEEMLQRV